jgi:hypothetical protein
MTAYATYDEFRDLTIMPQHDVDGLETRAPGFIERQLEYWSRWVDSRLRKRYAVPFQPPHPVAVTGWVVRLTTYRAYLRYGIDATDAQTEEISRDADRVKDEIAEAADSATGLFDLPLAEGSGSGISKGGPFVYSEASPYVWTDVQAETGRNEDRWGRGSGG